MILVLNCGSQSIKFKVFDDSFNVLEEDSANFPVDYSDDLRDIFLKLKEKYEVKAVGHRVVHGGDFFYDPIVVDDDILDKLEELEKLAPLHNPFNVLGIRKACEFFPKALNVAVFDTGFYRNLPEKAFVYAIPVSLAKEYSFRKFGFHGLSHQYAMEEAAKKMDREIEELKIITCHLGGGASVTAINKGRAVDTSMGYTPLEGLVMMTRSGDIDAGVVLELCKKFGVEETEKILNKESGIKGLCGVSNMLELIDGLESGKEESRRAFDAYVYRIKKYIGAYFAVLGGCDALVFTGTVGSGKQITRDEICEGMKILENVPVFFISANEELVIARKVFNVI